LDLLLHEHLRLERQEAAFLGAIFAKMPFRGVIREVAAEKDEDVSFLGQRRAVLMDPLVSGPERPDGRAVRASALGRKPAAFTVSHDVILLADA
jgi:hypothetical protein